MNTLKNIGKLFGLMAWAIGAFGGFGYGLHIGEPVTGICCLVLGAMAFPTVKTWFSFLGKKEK